MGSIGPSQILSTQTKELQRIALIKLYQSTNGDHWVPIRTEGWLSDALDECQWSGVQCDVNGTVRALFLDKAGLSGKIPDEIKYLTGIFELFLAGNSLTGTIPNAIGELKLLRYIFLNSNKLTGLIPTDIGNLISLQGLWMENNLLTGTLPVSMGRLSRLTSLTLDFNDLTGSLPPSIGNLISIKRLHLSYNRINGTLPKELEGMTSIEFLYLNDNQLQGKIPTSVSKMRNLQVLNIQNNFFSGTIPNDLSLIPNLSELDIGNNHIVGTIPEVLCGKVNINFEGIKNIRQQCDLIACPQQSFQPIEGRQYSIETSCIPCINGTQTEFLGSTHCTEKKIPFKTQGTIIVFWTRYKMLYAMCLCIITMIVMMWNIWKKHKCQRQVRRLTRKGRFVEIPSVEAGVYPKSSESVRSYYQSFESRHLIIA